MIGAKLCCTHDHTSPHKHAGVHTQTNTYPHLYIHNTYIHVRAYTHTACTHTHTQYTRIHRRPRIHTHKHTPTWWCAAVPTLSTPKLKNGWLSLASNSPSPICCLVRRTSDRSRSASVTRPVLSASGSQFRYACDPQSPQERSVPACSALAAASAVVLAYPCPLGSGLNMSPTAPQSDRDV